ncbi:selenocysteine lyase/cysteine desulfurase [Glaciihabitans tibetensis]|uniref:Selenocysteine lyase/cysteine desulfurase n=1 Tax=Glaciihabitans tibetensis TaxID=1266600 RepID=A0A2T0VJ59_9MICO|nr:aminotransferase class V-fold PLP-dependent enzyme [Glaciihabitans tibetensis]PRY70238.1 selenocysteine lyase/cysteine desulfurase [Glaciihabitans tibetensis]
MTSEPDSYSTADAHSAAVPTTAGGSAAFRAAVEQFPNGRGYLAAASMGLPSLDTVAALTADLQAWAGVKRSPAGYGELAERVRAHYARLVAVPGDRVAIGAQTSVFAGVIAQAVPRGAEVLCVDGDFSSMVFPFLQRSDITVRHIPLAELADSITDATWLVSFSLIQSATGEVADVPAITAAAAHHGARTFCDTTQAAGVYPIDASLFDSTVCHSYKWLCAPRGVAFLTVSDEFQQSLTPTFASWYGGESVWESCYGPTMRLARDARQFDLSPAWHAWAGAEESVRMFADLDVSEVWSHAAGLGNLLCDEWDIPRKNQAIVTRADPGGADLARLAAAGIVASGRAGRLRVAFHLWNTADDVEQLASVLRG